MAKAKYYIYDNHHRNRIRIHKGECPHCRFGKGRSNIPDKNRTVDKWIPCDSLPDAEKQAKRLNRKESKKCGICFP